MLSKPATVVMRPNQPSNERELNKPATVVMRRDQLSNEREPSSHKATDDAEDDAVGTEVDKSNDEEAHALHGFLASRGINSSPIGESTQ